MKQPALSRNGNEFPKDKQIDSAWKHLQSISDIIRSADTKASIVLAVIGVTSGLILRANAFELKGAGDIFAFGCMISGSVVMGFSTFFGISALVPRLRVNRSASLVYSASIAAHYKNAKERFVADYRNLLKDEEALLDSLAVEIWANSIVSRYKLQAVRRAAWLLAGGIVLFGISILLRFS